MSLGNTIARLNAEAAAAWRDTPCLRRRAVLTPGPHPLCLRHRWTILALGRWTCLTCGATKTGLAARP